MDSHSHTGGASCQYPLLQSILEVKTGATIVAINPSSGPVLGGSVVTLHGAGFINDATLECLFTVIDKTTGASVERTTSNVFVKSSRELSCRDVPPSPTGPGSSTISVRARGVVLGTSFAPYEYIPYLADYNTSTTVISTEGGTAVEVALRKHQLDQGRAVECRFEDEYVPAVLVNTTNLRCVSPRLDYSPSLQGDAAVGDMDTTGRHTIAFAISIEKVDMGAETRFEVIKPPTVRFNVEVYWCIFSVSLGMVHQKALILFYHILQ